MLWARLVLGGSSTVEQTEKRFIYPSLLAKDFLPSLGNKSVV